MLKITVHREKWNSTLTVEGQLDTCQIGKLRTAWKRILDGPRGRKLNIDLRGLTHVSLEGYRVLRQIASAIDSAAIGHRTADAA